MRVSLFVLVVGLLLTGCSAAATTELPAQNPTLIEQELTHPNPTGQNQKLPDLDEQVLNKRVNDPKDYSFSQLLPFDGIRPVYDPQFSSAADAPLQDDELVLGVAWDGEAKAYPITVLRFREMVNDELAGTPTLVTW